MRITLHEIKRLQEEFDKSHQGKIPFYEKISENNIDVLEHLIVCLVGEIGEFSNIVKKIRRGDFQLEDKKNVLDEELIDIFIYLIKISNQMDVDLEDGFLNKLEKNKNRFEKYLR
ncbi:MazG nucleotide pyrophosphohydrolase domain-containing protein [Nostoc sp.]|uniref:MazG nucleotide pyrophosphohydrolase domain-containing protein n=1 Tax=Nostoc sp. TaxID=1180 RepID=UPI002FFC85CD